MSARRCWLMVVAVLALAALGALAFPALASPPEPTPVPDTPAPPNVTPMMDRLAPPPTVVNPGQADLGAQLFWQHCQPCHGDQGQGLTDEWRAQYPPEDQNCWKSGCHGDRPYANGFTLPHAVPALLGPGTLGHFATVADLYTFMSQVMPFQAPGSLKPAEYWAISAFLLRAHGLPAADLPLADLTAARRISLAALAVPAAQPVAVVPPVVAVVATVAAAFALGGLGRLVWRWSRPHA